MKRRTTTNKRTIIAIGCAVAGLVIIAGGALVFGLHRELRTPADGPLSRQVMAYAEQEVIAHREPPPLAALHYAYIASAYDDALTIDGQRGALYAAEQMVKLFYATDSVSVITKFHNLARTNYVDEFTSSKNVPAPVAKVVANYKNRYATDGHTLAWDGVIPQGTGKWVSAIGQPPVTPRAGDWKRWVVTKPIQVPAPPVLGSAEDNKQLHIVMQAVAARTGEDIQQINFWAGSIGTETPSGIWQNQIFATIHGNLPTGAVAADKSYALIQKNAAQTMSDAFMECWKVKYTYWTARPDQRIPGLNTAMPDPNFPGYISGHSTVSKAAADVLSVMVPRYRDTWDAMAVQARNSRLVAGIHFDIDNSVGFDAGTEVAGQAIVSLHLLRVL